MKSLFILLTVIAFVACKNETKQPKTSVNDIKKEDITTSIYPENITKVFNAHGGVDAWNKMQTLSFTIDRTDDKEVTTTNLKTRAERIETATYTLGFDGNQIWVEEKGKPYKGNAWFYKGLMMYFYAMPFILADDGIIYEKAEPLVFEGKSYPGILISYDTGIGESPNDQYILYFDEATGQMQWLAYTVTFGKKEKSEHFSYIRYNNWQTTNGLKLPSSIAWYNLEDGKPVSERNVIKFSEVSLSETAPTDTLFVKSEKAKLIEKK